MTTTDTGATSHVVSWKTHEEFERRMDDLLREHKEQILAIQNQLDDTHDMVASVARLATSLEGMAKSLDRQGDDIREIRSTVESFNIEHIEITLNEHGQKLSDHENRIRQQEMKPLDSEDHECRLRSVEKRADSAADHEERLRVLEGKSGKNWEKVVSGIITGIVAFLIGMACTNLFK